MSKGYSFIFFFLLFLFKTGLSFSQAGVLDASFGDGGKVVTATGDSSSVANAVVVTAEGKILVGGYSFKEGKSVATLLQYNSDGSIDTTFGIAGKSSLPFPYESSISGIALQTDGKIIVAGYFHPFLTSFLLARFNKNGSIDSNFGVTGIAPAIQSNIFNAGSIAKRIVIKSDGKIVAGGTGYTSTFGVGSIVAQYLATGTIDSSFGNNGIVGLGFYFLGGVADGINDLDLTTDGKIVAIVNESPQGVLNQTDFEIQKLLPNGNRDSSFGINGIVRTDVDAVSGDDAYSAVNLIDNSIVVTGSCYKYIYDPVTNSYHRSTSFALVKYQSNGSLDSTFGINGKVLTLVLPDSTAYPNHILLSTNGNFVVSGYALNNKLDFLLARYLSNGKSDSSFGSNGITFTDFSGTGDYSYSSALQPDGKIVLAGSSGDDKNYNIALSRYNNLLIYPLQLLSFTASKKENNNLLRWRTAQETNTSQFEVQRSGNGKDYAILGYVNAGKGAYQFTDRKPFDGLNTYRLKIIDKNGAFEYSPVRMINNSRSLSLQVYPNPARNNLQVHIYNNEATRLEWKIVSTEGKAMMTNEWSVEAVGLVKNINISMLAKGTYYLVITTKTNEQSVVKFEKIGL